MRDSEPGTFSSSNGELASFEGTDDYAFFRSFVAAQAARDPELAAALAQCQQQNAGAEVPCHKHGEQQQCAQQNEEQQEAGCRAATVAQTSKQHLRSSRSDDGSAGTNNTTVIVDHQQQSQSAGCAQAGVCGEHIQAVTATEAAAAQVAAHESQLPKQEQLGGPSGPSSSGLKPTTALQLIISRPDFTRNQIRSLRKLFPIQSPLMKSAAMLQGEYQLLDVLGRGAFGTACKARHLASGALVCIKSIEGQGHASQLNLEQQKREVAVLAALKHPNIIRYHDCFSDCAKNHLHIVMEWADGGDLAGLLQQQAKAATHLPEGRLLAYFVQLVLALAHIHGAGVMHRDLKTCNIFITSSGLLKLGDFGIAKVLDAPGAHSSSGSRPGSMAGSSGSSSGAASVVTAMNAGPMAQSFVGTPNYLAPEMINCEPYNQKADIWAVGCVLYEMAALRPAFKADRIPLIYRLIRRGRTSPLPAIYSAGLRSLVTRLIAKDPGARPSSAELLQDELLRPYLEQYKQQLQQLGIDLPQPTAPPGYATATNSTNGTSLNSATSTSDGASSANGSSSIIRAGGLAGDTTPLSSSLTHHNNNSLSVAKVGHDELIGPLGHANASSGAGSGLNSVDMAVSIDMFHSPSSSDSGQAPAAGACQAGNNVTITNIDSGVCHTSLIHLEECIHTVSCQRCSSASQHASKQQQSLSAAFVFLQQTDKQQHNDKQQFEDMPCGSSAATNQKRLWQQFSLTCCLKQPSVCDVPPTAPRATATKAAVASTQSSSGSAGSNGGQNAACSAEDFVGRSLPDAVQLEQQQLQQQLQPLRHTLSAVLSSTYSNASAVTSCGLSATGCHQSGSAVLSTGGAAKAEGPIAAATAAAEGCPTAGNSSSCFQPAASRWSQMLTAAGLPFASQQAAEAGNEAAGTTSLQTQGLQQEAGAVQQQPQQACDYYMQQLAARYNAQLLLAEHSGLSTISERSESRTTPRANKIK